MNKELNIEKKGLQLDEKSNRKHSLSDISKCTDEIECETAKKIKTTQDPFTLASSTSCNNKTEEQDEQIEIDLIDIKKQLEIELLIEICKYEVQLNHAVCSTKKWPDFFCVVNDIPILNSEIKLLGVTSFRKKKDFVKLHLIAKKLINQQLNLKGGLGVAGLLINIDIMQ
ncbi:2857_t:CDS:2 [Racocetra fulgida]|uniref:2857_t:CDS:1 n=1 Tax=Racocetra fulgida TaxID=60492 RepID=A0A9N8VPM6_9GLOM|nr:2857_t:CDS:2 [Racocetra fulgida]